MANSSEVERSLIKWQKVSAPKIENDLAPVALPITASVTENASSLSAAGNPGSGRHNHESCLGAVHLNVNRMNRK